MNITFGSRTSKKNPSRLIIKPLQSASVQTYLDAAEALGLEPGTRLTIAGEEFVFKNCSPRFVEVTINAVKYKPKRKRTTGK